MPVQEWTLQPAAGDNDAWRCPGRRNVCVVVLTAHWAASLRLICANQKKKAQHDCLPPGLEGVRKNCVFHERALIFFLNAKYLVILMGRSRRKAERSSGSKIIAMVFVVSVLTHILSYTLLSSTWDSESAVERPTKYPQILF